MSPSQLTDHQVLVSNMCWNLVQGEGMLGNWLHQSRAASGPRAGAGQGEAQPFIGHGQGAATQKEGRPVGCQRLSPRMGGRLGSLWEEARPFADILRQPSACPPAPFLLWGPTRHLGIQEQFVKRSPCRQQDSQEEGQCGGGGELKGVKHALPHTHTHHQHQHSPAQARDPVSAPVTRQKRSSWWQQF